jgi:glycosyltransferase involved in cell wall biosynthesis
MSRHPISDQTIIAVILPCYNEEHAIKDVVSAFKHHLPRATVCVFDNNSSDATASEARAAGAEVYTVKRRGKGHVLRQAFAQIEADAYILADGDGTYDASAAPELVEALVRDHLDMVVGTRALAGDIAYRAGHHFGNRFFNWVVARLFAGTFTDIFSGYRVLSRRFVKSFPALSSGFETETEISLHAIQLGLPVIEISTRYSERAGGSASKLSTLRDGSRILWFIVRLTKHTRPLLLFASAAGLLTVVALVIGLPIVVEFLESGLVPRLPTAVAAASLMVIAAISLVTGVILDSVAYTQQEAKRLAYLATAPRVSALRKAADAPGD